MATENRRLKELSRWISGGQRPINSEFAAIAAKSAKLKGVKESKTDPRERIFSISVDDRMGHKLAVIANKANCGNDKMKVSYAGASWSRKVCQGSLNSIYEGLRSIIGNDHPLLRETRDMKLRDLFDVLEAFEMGLELKVPGIGQKFEIKTPLQLANFMENLLHERSKSRIAQAIFSSPASLKKLESVPEDMRMSTLLRVLDHFGVKPAVADIKEQYLRKSEAGRVNNEKSELLEVWATSSARSETKSGKGLSYN